jgi:manganese/zinc/iron transport system permease protein
MAVTVIGLKLVGLILIVALLIIPPVTARFWTERADRVIWIAGAARRRLGLCRRGALGLGAGLPTGPIIVLSFAALFALSLFLAPVRGSPRRSCGTAGSSARVHRRQGLLALARSASRSTSPDAAPSARARG